MPATSDPAVTTTLTELPESRVKLEVHVSAQEVARRMAETARHLGKDLRMPGFRKGHVPPPVVIQRIGREAVLDETLRSRLGTWYVEALEAAGVKHPVGDPDIDLGELPAEGEPLAFTVEIGVRPKAQLGDYLGIEVPRREPAADPEQVDAQIDQIRNSHATLETADRAAARGDFVVVDFVGSVDGEPFPGGEGRDQMIELGGGRLVPGFEEQLEGAVAGEERTVTVTFPDDYPAEHLGGQEASFAVSVKEVKVKQLPDLDDDFAADATGFDTLQELKDDIASKLEETDGRRVEQEFREAALDAVAANATIDVPAALVDARAKEMWERMLHSLSHQGITREAYLRISGQDEEAILAEARPDAEQALRREAVVEAIIEAEGIAPSEGDVLDALQAPAAQERTTPEKLLGRLRKSGRLAALEEDLAQRRAIELVAEKATAIDPGRAEAREKLWTPGKD